MCSSDLNPINGFVCDSVEEEIAFTLENLGYQADVMRKRVEEILDLLALTPLRRRELATLSGGEQQRVDIARALLNSPKLILADEPTGSLDPETSDEIMQLLFQIAKDYGTAIVMATHDFMVVNKFPSRTLKTQGGRLTEQA